MSRLIFAGLTAPFALVPIAVALAGPPSEVPVSVTNPVLQVEVSNADPLQVQVGVSAENPARQPFGVKTRNLDLSGQRFFDSTDFLTVPAGKRAVLEHLSCGGALDDSVDFLETTLLIDTSSTALEIHFAPSVIGKSDLVLDVGGGLPVYVVPINRWVVNQPFRAYVDSGKRVSFDVRRDYGPYDAPEFSPSVNRGSMLCTLIGHFVDVE